MPEAWVNRGDECALRLMKKLVRSSRSHAEAAVLSLDPAFRRRLAECPLEEKRHILEELSPGMLASLRIMGLCEEADSRGRPVCRGWTRRILDPFGLWHHVGHVVGIPSSHAEAAEQ